MSGSAIRRRRSGELAGERRSSAALGLMHAVEQVLRLLNSRRHLAARLGCFYSKVILFFYLSQTRRAAPILLRACARLACASPPHQEEQSGSYKLACTLRLHQGWWIGEACSAARNRPQQVACARCGAADAAAAAAAAAAAGRRRVARRFFGAFFFSFF